MREKDLHIIEKYLNGKLSEEEKPDFEIRMRDPEFRATVSQMRASIISIKQAVLDEKLALLKEEEIKLATLDKKSFRLTPAYSWIAVAALILAAVFLVRPLIETNDTIRHPYLAEHFDEFVIHDTYKGSKEDTLYIGLMRGYNLFAVKEFEKAIPILKDNWDSNQDTLSLFYLWLSAVGTENSTIKHQYEDEIKMLSGNNKYSNYLNYLIENKPAN